VECPEEPSRWTAAFGDYCRRPNPWRALPPGHAAHYQHRLRLVGGIGHELAVAGDNEPGDDREHLVAVRQAMNGENCVHVESPPLGNKFCRLKP